MKLFYCTGCYAVYKARVFCPNPVCIHSYRACTEPLEDESRDYAIGDEIRCLTDTFYTSSRTRHARGGVYKVTDETVELINGNKAAYELVK